jgi:sugar fermentation stimulation protein A
MRFDPPLAEAKFIRRYQRFFAEVIDTPGSANGVLDVAHVANTGSLMSVLSAGAPCWLQKAKNPDRKLKWSLMAVKTPTSWVGVNTSLPNHLIQEAFEGGRIWQDKANWSAKMEVKISEKSRIDMVLSQGPHSHYIEIKNVTLLREDANGVRSVQFPDSVTERGQKHIDELVHIAKKGSGAELVFVVQRGDTRRFSLAQDIDPVYAEKLIDARKKGVQVRAFEVDLSPEEFTISGRELSLDF